MALPIPKAVLAQHTAVLGKTRSGKSSTMRLLVESLLDDQKPVCIIDPKGDWWGIKSSADGKQAGYEVVIFGGKHADVPINAHSGKVVGELVATGNRPCLIDLGGWMVGERTRFFVDFASTLFTRTRGHRWLVIDECHNFAPQGKILDPDAGKMLHWSNRLASEGAGKGVVLISASQRPQKVHKDYLTSHETLIAKRVIHPLDRGAMKEWIDGCGDPALGKEVLNTMAELQRNQGWVWSPEIGFGPKLIEFPMFATYDSFKVQTGDGDKKLKGWAEVDLEEVKTKLAAAIEEDKANDPKALKAEIASLKRELAAKPKPNGVDHDVTRKATAEGYERGLAEGLARGESRAKAALAAVQSRLNDALTMAGASLTALDSPMPAPLSRRQVTAPPIRAAREPLRAPTSSDGASLPRAERLVLTALAQYPAGRTKNQVAILAGYAVNGGGFNNAISSLRTAGRLQGSGDRLQITDQGFADLGPFDPLPHGDALLQHWMGQLGKAEKSALSALAEVYPNPMSKDEVAARAGYEANGGGFNNAISRLRSLELIEGRGELRASEALFG